jgi:hypothetical protein
LEQAGDRSGKSEKANSAETALQTQAADLLSSQSRTKDTRDDSPSQIDIYKDRLSRRLEKSIRERHTPAPDRDPGMKSGHSPEAVAMEKKLVKESAQMSKADRQQFISHMHTFLERAGKQNLDEKNEVVGTLAACERLLNPGGERLFLDRMFGRSKGGHLRTMLAEQIMNRAAYPSRTDQGLFGTCPAASLETRTWFARPAVAASIIASQALAGQWTTADGHVLKLPKINFATDKYSQQTTPPDGMRNYAGQLFQATALSDVGIRQPLPVYYSTGGIVKNAQGHDVGIEYWSDAGGKKVAEYDGIDDIPDAFELERLDGVNTQFFSSDSADAGSNAHIILFKDKEDLKAKLKEAQESGKMPVLITVASNDKFFFDVDPEEPHILDHDICIDRYDPETGRVVIDNQWGASFDWGTRSVLGSKHDEHPSASIDDFYPSTLGQPGVSNLHRLRRPRS